MLQLRDIMTTDVTVLGPEMTIHTAMDVLSSYHISGAPVVTGRQVVGVVSSTDLLSLAAELRGHAAEWRDIEDDESLDDDIEGNEPAGAFFHDLWSDVRGPATGMMGRLDSREWNVLDEPTVAEAMNNAVFSLAPNTPVDYAADYMRSRDIHRILVMDNQQLLGIVTTTDIADAVADHKLTSRTYVFEKPVVR